MMSEKESSFRFDFIEEVQKSGDRLGLESVNNLFIQLQNIQEQLPVVQVVGTNGKGSVCCFLSSILQEAGFKVGRFSSPQVFSYAERFVINDSPIKEDDFAKVLAPIKAAYHRMQHNGQLLPTLFEVETAVAVSYFVKEHCDLAIMEAGMGGDLDATNVFTHPLLAVFTSIGLDHMQFLGNSPEEVAFHKAGIIKSGEIAVSIWQDQRVRDVLQTKADQLQASISFADPALLRLESVDPVSFSYGEFRNVKLRMSGTYQADNAVVTLHAIRALCEQGFSVTENHIRSGFLRALWPGRMERLSCDGNVYLDGAHNVLAARSLSDTITRLFPGKTITMILGMLKDKEYQKVLHILIPHASHVITVTPPGERGLEKDILANEAMAYIEEKRVSCAATPEEAAAMASKTCDDIILVTGTLTILADFKALFEGKEHMV